MRPFKDELYLGAQEIQASISRPQARISVVDVVVGVITITTVLLNSVIRIISIVNFTVIIFVVVVDDDDADHVDDDNGDDTDENEDLDKRKSIVLIKT